MMRKRLIIATALFLSGSLARGQEPAKQWSLEECIRYAIEHAKEGDVIVLAGWVL